MKKFQWPLRRLLDVTTQRERALRMDLFRLSQKIADVHRRIFRRRAALRDLAYLFPAFVIPITGFLAPYLHCQGLRHQ